MNFKDEYIESILEINKNLRNQLENIYKLLRIKIKIESEENSRLENIINELEILKTSFSFNIQKNSNIVSKTYLNNLENMKNLESQLNSKENIDKLIQEKDVMIEDLQNTLEKQKQENVNFQETYDSLIERNSLLKVELNNLVSDLSVIKIELSDSKQCLDDEKVKNRNLVSLIKDLEKKKSNSKVEAECNELKQQIHLLNTKLIELENKYKGRLEKKEIIIKKLDEQLVEYEEQLRYYKNLHN